MITLRRAYLDDVTLGYLDVGNNTYSVLELPWRGNEPRRSCIPEGVYTMRLRQSQVVTRTTGGRHAQGWEVQEVPGRSFIMFHPGNYTRNTDGCLLPGRRFSWTSAEGFMVTDSQITFEALMNCLSAQQEWNIDIRTNRPEYP